jgi:hypothetical protein
MALAAVIPIHNTSGRLGDELGEMEIYRLGRSLHLADETLFEQTISSSFIYFALLASKFGRTVVFVFAEGGGRTFLFESTSPSILRTHGTRILNFSTLTPVPS